MLLEMIEKIGQSLALTEKNSPILEALIIDDNEVLQVAKQLLAYSVELEIKVIKKDELISYLISKISALKAENESLSSQIIVKEGL